MLYNLCSNDGPYGTQWVYIKKKQKKQEHKQKQSNRLLLLPEAGLQAQQSANGASIQHSCRVFGSRGNLLSCLSQGTCLHPFKGNSHIAQQPTGWKCKAVVLSKRETEFNLYFEGSSESLGNQFRLAVSSFFVIVQFVYRQEAFMCCCILKLTG